MIEWINYNKQKPELGRMIHYIEAYSIEVYTDEYTQENIDSGFIDFVVMWTYTD